MANQSLSALRAWALAADLAAREAIYTADGDAVEYARGEAESYTWWWLHLSEVTALDGLALEQLAGWAESLAAADHRLSLEARGAGRQAATGHVLRAIAFARK